ncbi:MAG: efflux RND transporter periplasmic adaptor subunit [Methylophilus sp.]|nr:efflux RND transporter periplasmic adaptor subunit [Methylophilus sp.]
MNSIVRPFFFCLLGLLAIGLVACNIDSNPAGTQHEEAREAKATLITVTQIKSQPLESTEETVGSLEGLIDPTVAAEVAARVIKVLVSPGQEVKQGQLIATLDATDFAMQRNEAQAEVERIQALLENQAKVVARNQALVNKKFISQNAVDNELAQQNVLLQQLQAAKARVGSINHSSSKSKVIAPVSGIIEKKLVDTGDFVRIGDPIVQIVSKQRLRAHLPFPERIGALLKPGLKVRLSTPTSKNSLETEIKELKPLITEGNRTIDAIADINNAEGWQPGASVTGTVILDTLPIAMMVPEQSVVLRPAGEVVYVVRDNVAYQAIVKTGLRQNGMIEVLSGLNLNDVVVVDGAGFLTDQAPVKIASGHATSNRHARNQ